MTALPRAAELPRRTAHATHALLVASREAHMPVTAGEAQVYDEEALSARSTAAGLKDARRRGLCFYVGGLWAPTPLAHEIQLDLEDRYLEDTAREGE